MVKAAGEQLTSRPTATAPVVDSTHFQAAIIQEQNQPGPVIERIADGLGQS
jgi:hypothetical protein